MISSRMRFTPILAGVAILALTVCSLNTFAAKKDKKKMNDKHVVTTPSGLKYEDLVVGTGAAPKTGQMVTVNYTGWLESGKPFDSNTDPKFNHVEPFEFKIGTRQVIAGWDEGVGSMKVGGKRKLTIPPVLGYGAQNVGNGLIPPNSVLIFEVELKGVK